MSEFRPRKGSYIRERNGQFYYRRAIPVAFRHMYGGLTEWNIRLEGRTNAERLSEAHTHAHQHNRDMEFGLGGRILSHVEETQTAEGPDMSVRLDFTDLPLPDGIVLKPFLAYRNGQLRETDRIAISRDPDFLRKAERDGFLSMSYDEGQAQLERTSS